MVCPANQNPEPSRFPATLCAVWQLRRLFGGSLCLSHTTIANCHLGTRPDIRQNRTQAGRWAEMHAGRPTALRLLPADKCLPPASPCWAYWRPSKHPKKIAKDINNMLDRSVFRNKWPPSKYGKSDLLSLASAAFFLPLHILSEVLRTELNRGREVALKQNWARVQQKARAAALW